MAGAKGGKGSAKGGAPRQLSGYDLYVARPLSYVGAALFCVLMLTTLFGMLASIPRLSLIADIAERVASSDILTGAVVGAAVAFSLTASPIELFTAIVAGAVGCSYSSVLAALLASYISMLISYAVAGRSKWDMLLIPILAGGVAILCSVLFGGPLAKLHSLAAGLITSAMTLKPWLSSMLIAVIAGMLSATPLSMGLICSLAVTSPEIAGVAFIGVSAHQIAFAVSGRGDNPPAVTLATALGSVKLHMGNIARRPLVWIIPILASAVSGFIAGMVGFTCPESCVPMGFTALDSLRVMLSSGLSDPAWSVFEALIFGAGIPIVLAALLDRLFRKSGLIHTGDLTVDI